MSDERNKLEQDGRETDEALSPRNEAGEASVSSVEDVSDPSPHDKRVAELMSHTIDVPVLASAVELQAAADAADTLEDLEEDEAAEVLHEMKDRAAASALSEMEMPLAAGVMEDLIDEDSSHAGRLIEQMADDDAADLLQALDEPYRERLLGMIDRVPAKELVELIQYDRESAGGMMTTEFLDLRQDMQVHEAIEFIRDNPISEQAQNALVTDDENHLVGIIALHRLLLTQSQDRIVDLMKRSVKAIRPDTDREEVAREFDRYDYSMLPVVDENDFLLGIVTVDDVIDIIRAEQTEDVQKTVGAGAREAVYSGVFEKFRGRFPWLLMSLFMMIPAAIIILKFEDLISRVPVLAVLMPVIAAVVGNAGHQALAVTQRGLVLDEVRPERVSPLLLRELMVGLLSGFVLGLIILVSVGLLSRLSPSATWGLGLMTGIGTMIAMSVGTLFGSAIPLLMKRLGFDPAQSSAIFLIMITDAVAFGTILSLSLMIYERVQVAGLFG